MMKSAGTPNWKVKPIEAFVAGESQSFVVNITAELVASFADLTGDYNPLHMDDGFARTTVFRNRVVHGMLAGSFVSTLIGMYLPGPGSLWLSQNFEFLIPVRIGDTLRIEGVVSRVSIEQGILFIDVSVFNQTGLIVVRGEGKVKIVKEKEQMMHKPLNECRVLVVGGSRGLGASIALAFAKQGAKVIVNYARSSQAAEDLAKQAKDIDGAVIDLVQGDFTQAQGVEAISAQLGAKGVDIVILSGLADLKQGLFLEQSIKDFERGLDFGMRGPFMLLQSLLPKMIEQKFGRIVSILSTYAVGAPPAGFSSYVVNKKALEGLTKSIAVEYGRYNITANMVSPNMLRTDLTANTPERAKQLLEAQTPLKRLASLDEVAGSVMYLCSPAAAYVNGHNLIISGGSSIT